jgi:acyl-CoA synthetase (AMP-forming)/AMP-acid ligase II
MSLAGDAAVDFTPGPGETAHLGRLYEETADRHPDRVALIDGETDETVTYGGVADNVAAAGNALAGLGVERGDRVALCLRNEFAFVYAFFGAARLGAVPVPVNVQTTREKFRAIVADSGAEVVVAGTDDGVLGHVAAVAAAGESVETVAVATDDPGPIEGVETVSFAAAMAAADTDLEPAPVAPDDPAMQPYTSGSTGTPKGVVLTHGGCVWLVRCVSRLHFLDASDRAIVAGPLYHKNAMAGAVKPMLAVGGSVVVMDGFDPEAVIAAIARHGVTYLRGVPAMYKMLVGAESALAAHDVSSVEWAIAGSASLPETLVEDVRETFGCAMGEAYGLTETGGPVTLSPRWGPRKLGSSGLPFPGADIRIVDPETDEELTPGETGELVVSAPSNGSYYRRPEAEAEAFFGRDGRRFLHTDDLARMDEQGYVYIVGRLDDMLVVGGENVYPDEVEALLLEHPAASDAAVVGVPHAIKGVAPVAFVVADGVTEEELKRHTIRNGPAYAHPRRVFFLADLPLAGTGKTDYDALEREALERIPGGELQASERVDVEADGDGQESEDGA